MPKGKPILIAALFIAGVMMWASVPRAFAPVPISSWMTTCLLVAIGFIPQVNAAVARWFAILEQPSARNRARTALLIAIVATIYLIFTAHRQDRDFFPKTLDDQSYVIQMQMLARGKLWMPEHPCADFFDTFHVLVKPKYASAYFPGTALVYVPLIWLHLPVWIGPVLVAGAILGLTYAMVAEMADGVAGAIAALLVLSTNWFRMLSILVYGQTIPMLLGLLMLWAWMRWREAQKSKWALLIGAFSGLMAITRPVDAICYALPIAVGMCLPLRGKTTRHAARTIALFIAGALPFLAIQAIQNIGITGHLTQTPFSLYLGRDQPGANFGFHPYDPSQQPASVVAQKQLYYRDFIVPFIQKHSLSQTGTWFKEHFKQIIDATLPAREMIILLPVGLLALGRRPRRWALAAIVPLFFALYFCYPPFVEHYAVPFAPGFALVVAMAPGVLRDSIPRVGRALYVMSVIAILIVSLSMLPELNPKVDDESFRSRMMRVIDDQLDQVVQAPAVVLFKYHPELPLAVHEDPSQGLPIYNNSPMCEPVYNTDVAWPDDAPIIRAHDLGNRNLEIFRYYAQRQPQRMFYLFDRGNLADPLHELGRASDLAKSP